MSVSETAAKALYVLDCEQHDVAVHPWSTVPAARKDLLRDQARAVFRAVRAPSPAVVTAVSDYDSEGGYDTNAVAGEFEPNAARLWRAMVDAALAGL